MSDFGIQSQAIYRYWNGERRWWFFPRKVNGDPLRIIRDLTADENHSLELDMQESELESPKAIAALGRVCQAVRKAFRVKPLEEGGLSDLACVALLNHFLLWMADQKKTIDRLRTSFTPTGPELLVEDSPPTNSSASGSTAAESKPSNPTPSLAESASH